MIDANDQKQIQLMIDISLKKAMDFQTRKRGDTPTDDLQLTPKKYVDSKVGIGGSDTDIQFNNAGSFGGSSALTWDANNNAITITDSGTGYILISGAGPGDFHIDSSDNISITATKYLSLGSSTNDVILSSNGLSSTTATHGFIRIPFVTGAPTGTPATGVPGLAMAYDSTNNKLYVYNGGWKSVLLSKL